MSTEQQIKQIGMEDRIGLLVARKRYLVGSRVQITTKKIDSCREGSFATPGW